MGQLVNFVTASTSIFAGQPSWSEDWSIKNSGDAAGRSDHMEAAAKTTPLQLAALRSGGSPKICSAQGALQALRKLGAVNDSQLPPFFGGIAQAQGSGGRASTAAAFKIPEGVKMHLFYAIEPCSPSNLFREFWVASTLLVYCSICEYTVAVLDGSILANCPRGAVFDATLFYVGSNLLFN